MNEKIQKIIIYVYLLENPFSLNNPKLDEKNSDIYLFQYNKMALDLHNL